MLMHRHIGPSCYRSLLQSLLWSQSWFGVGVRVAGWWCWFVWTKKVRSRPVFSQDLEPQHGASYTERSLLLPGIRKYQSDNN